MKKIDPEKTKRFLKNSIIAAVIAIAVWYVWHSFGGVFGRSFSAVDGTEWLSWSSGSLYFGEGSGEYRTSSGVKDFSYEQRSGIVELSSSGSVFLVLSRLGSDEMITSDGHSLFYLKGSWSGEGSSDAS